MDGREYYRNLLRKYVAHVATAWEIDELMAELHRNTDDEEWQEMIRNVFVDAPAENDVAFDEARWQPVIEKILHNDNRADTDLPPTPATIRRITTKFWPIAAAIALLIIAGSIIYYYNSPRDNANRSVAIVSPDPMQNDVAPGGDHATLTLANGRKIILDSAANGQLAKEGASVITKTKSGEVKYSSQSINPRDRGTTLTYNTMSTPRGGQYHLTLPDGTQVWLNAASSISYPTAFAQNERRVSITGEVYFEVAHNKRSPFRVEIGTPLGTKPIAPAPDAPTIEVLGTHFNINAYTEEQNIKTTLLEGSVQIKNVHTSLILKPGQQGLAETDLQVNGSRRLVLADNPDLEQVVAWKNGMFLMSNTDLPAILRQVSRWYDIDIRYETTPKKQTFDGGISRNLPLSDILSLLKNFGVTTRLEGRTLYVRP